ncbi:sterile alpha motif domain-containing protein 7 isoform X2 [Coturnix japonica]|uniref:sterile alpha motif domain-containing protein 7 isoform X2 n=1 Tax=Coturnix japonica TaxID=93934 RepID=UPI000777CA74|nr:sterile alpha motif domain-containing protein 7 isoform X2 [Coturnix japonica]
MTPREHMRKMSILGEQGALDEKHLYRLASGMAAGELRQRQEMLMRNQLMAVNPQLMGTAQQRMQAIPSQFEPRLVDRDLLPSTDMTATADPRQIHITSHLGPTVPQHSSMPNLLSNRIYPGPGYGFLQPESMEAVARRQELVQKQNIARMEMEMSAIFQQKEMEKAHRKGLLSLEAPFLYHGMPASPIAFRGRHRLPEGHLPSDLYVHRTTLDEIHGNTMLMATSPYPPVSTLQRERGRRPGRRAANHKAADCGANGTKSQTEDKSMDLASTAGDDEKEDKKEAEVETPNKHEQSKNQAEPPAVVKNCKELEQDLRKNCANHEISAEPNSCNSTSEKESNSSCAAFDDKYMYPSAIPFSALPYGFPVPSNPLLPPAHGLILNGEDISTIEDIRKWTVDDVYNFIISLPGCSDYAQIFKDHAIDGETLPLLTEEHLLDTMGLKLGPALKIRSQVSRRLGNVFYMMNLPLSVPLPPAPGKPPEQPSDITSPLRCNSSGDVLDSPCSQGLETSKTVEQIVSESREHPCDADGPQADFQMIAFQKS